jgi:hypothetical protein
VRVVADSHALVFYLFLPHRLTERALEALGQAEDSGGVLDPATNLEVAAITPETMEHFDRVPLAELADPFDRFILATAAQLRLSLVTADRAMSAAGLAEVLW